MSYLVITCLLLSGLAKTIILSLLLFQNRSICEQSMQQVLRRFSSNSVLAILQQSFKRTSWRSQPLKVKHSNMSGFAARIPFTQDFFFKQLFDRESCTFTYILADSQSKEAILIDPVIDLVERDTKILKEIGLNLIYALNTHMHADHITGTGVLKQLVSSVKSVISTHSQAEADIHVKHLDIIEFGRHKLEVRETPGHTNGTCKIQLSVYRKI